MLSHASTFQLKKIFFKYTSWQIHDSRHTTHDTSQQVTSKTPATKQKDPKKVAAGKALQEKNRKAREEQRKIFEAQKNALDEANMKIAKYELKNVETPVDTPVDKNVLTTTQWLSVISIVVSLAGTTTNVKRSKACLQNQRLRLLTHLLILRQNQRQ